jgi:hypothetical protein
MSAAFTLLYGQQPAALRTGRFQEPAATKRVLKPADATRLQFNQESTGEADAKPCRRQDIWDRQRRQKEISGLEFVQGLVDGTLPLNTIAETLGYDVTEAVSGRVVVTAEPSRAHLNPAGTVHGGLAATLLDSCMGLAIQFRLWRRASVRRPSSSRFHSCGSSRRKQV